MRSETCVVAVADPALRFRLVRALEDAGLASESVLSRERLYRALLRAESRLRRPLALVLDARREELGVEPLLWLSVSGVPLVSIVVTDDDDALAHKLAQDIEALGRFDAEADATEIVELLQFGVSRSPWFAGGAARRLPRWSGGLA
jgi:hypothetical protein